MGTEISVDLEDWMVRIDVHAGDKIIDLSFRRESM
jgi:hypothetical protein